MEDSMVQRTSSKHSSVLALGPNLFIKSPVSQNYWCALDTRTKSIYKDSSLPELLVPTQPPNPEYTTPSCPTYSHRVLWRLREFILK